MRPARGGRRRRPVRLRGVGSARWRGWAHPPPPRRRRAREGGGQRVGGVGRHPARVERAVGVDRRCFVGKRRRSLLRHRHLDDRAPPQPARPHLSRQPAPLRHRRHRLVRRRRRPHPVLPVPRGRRPLPPVARRGVLSPRRRRPPIVETGLRRVLPAAPPGGGPRHRRDLLRPPHRAARRGVGVPAGPGRRNRRRLPARRGAAVGHGVRTGRGDLASAPSRPLRRVQPGLGPGHPVRVGDRRPHREHPVLAATAGALGPRRRAATGVPGGAAARRAHRAAARTGWPDLLVGGETAAAARIRTPGLPTGCRGVGR